MFIHSRPSQADINQPFVYSRSGETKELQLQLVVGARIAILMFVDRWHGGAKRLTSQHYRKCAHRLPSPRLNLWSLPDVSTVIQPCFLFSCSPLCSTFAPLIRVKFLPRERRSGRPGRSCCYVYWRGCQRKE